MIKKIVIIFAVLVSVLNSSTTVKAFDHDEEIEYPIPDDYVAPEHYYTEAEIEIINSLVTAPEEPTRQIIDSSLLEGGVGSLKGLTLSQMDKVFNAAKVNGIKVLMTQYGSQYFEFSSGNDTIYVPKSILYKSSSGTCSNSELNSTMTTKANNRSTTAANGYVYKSIMFLDPDGNTVYRYNITKLDIYTGQADNSQWMNKVVVADTIGFDVYPTFVYCASYTTEVLKIKPTIEFQVTNTGSTSNGFYLGSYYFIGLGENTTNLDISEIVSIGYKAYELFSSQPTTGLTIKTLKSAFDLTSLLLSKVSKSGRKEYTYSGTQFLSSPGDGIYSYKCSNGSAYYVKKQNDYFEFKIGYIGNLLTNTRFSISYSFSITQ